VSSPDAIRARLPEERNQSIFVSHGTSDMMIPISGGRDSRDFLEAEGYTFEYHEYAMGHEINQQVLDDMVAWANNVLPPGGQD
jgi:phospholipase/carboxylesterase